MSRLPAEQHSGSASASCCSIADIYNLTPPLPAQVPDRHPKMLWQHCDHDSSKHINLKWDFFPIIRRPVRARARRMHASETSGNLRSRPVRRCAALQFWPSCCSSRGRNGLYVGRRQQLPRPVRLPLYRPTAGSRRSQRPAVWSPQVMYSCGVRDGKGKWQIVQH